MKLPALSTVGWLALAVVVPGGLALLASPDLRRRARWLVGWYTDADRTGESGGLLVELDTNLEDRRWTRGLVTGRDPARVVGGAPNGARTQPGAFTAPPGVSPQLYVPPTCSKPLNPAR